MVMECSTSKMGVAPLVVGKMIEKMELSLKKIPREK
jgi:hypothetical protein